MIIKMKYLATISESISQIKIETRKPKEERNLNVFPYSLFLDCNFSSFFLFFSFWQFLSFNFLKKKNIFYYF
jgi:hypothetical protein